MHGNARALKGVGVSDGSSGHGHLSPQVMFLQRRGQVIMTIELLDTEEAQAEDPVEVQVSAPVVCPQLCCFVPYCLDPAYAHTTHHSGTVLVMSPTVLTAKSIPM